MCGTWDEKPFAFKKYTTRGTLALLCRDIEQNRGPEELAFHQFVEAFASEFLETLDPTKLAKEVVFLKQHAGPNQFRPFHRTDVVMSQQ